MIGRTLSSSFLIFCSLFAPGEWAQTAQHQQGGMATGGVFKPVLDSANRPITAGGTVKKGPAIFINIAERSGLTKWHHNAGSAEKNFILEAKGAGVALLDYDNDGWLDIYIVNGSTYKALEGKEAPPRAALFHNNHDGYLHKTSQPRPG